MKPLPTSARWGLLFLALLAAIAFFAPELPLEDPAHIQLEQRLLAPEWTQAPYWGTDSKGRDLLSRVLFGARVSLATGLFGSLLALLIGVPWGGLAGLIGGRVDRAMMRLADAMESMPMVVLVLFLLSILSEYRIELAEYGIGRMHVFYLAVGILFWLPTARIARAEALRLRNSAFVQAAYGVGSSRFRIFTFHLLPNMAPSILAMLGITVPRVVLMEAFLSFLGLGVESPAVSWGLLASDGLATLNPLVDCWWLIAFPAGALVVSLLALNLVADGFRDWLSESH
ncbi:MAG: ABC transporter permease [Planctomycetota bacterium]|jgi:oligopeptide transport system permease protein|nr:ABC transporter permease [Planctomycetota bacterium]MDP6942181.1 ABC transporter permease [Planctomycetota bacterium]